MIEKRNILILSCSTGGGHNAAGYAIQEQFEAAGYPVTMMNYMDLAGKHVSSLVDNSYVNLVKKSPKAFGVLYKAGMLVSSSKHHSPVYYANAAVAKYLKEYLEEHPADIIFATHLYAAETLTYLKKQMKLPLTVAIATDYTCIPFWEETDCDAYVIPHKDLAAEYVARGLPKEKLYPLGIPVSLKFRRRWQDSETRSELELPPHGNLWLLMGGSMGFGHLQELAEAIEGQLREEESLVVICGSNQKMKAQLEAHFAGKEQIRIVGKTDQVAAYMAISAVVYTKPGGLTSTEAAVSRCPLVHTEPIPGCESENLRYFTERGMSVAADTPKEQAVLGRKLIDDSVMREKMNFAQQEYTDACTSKRIFEFFGQIPGSEPKCGEEAGSALETQEAAADEEEESEESLQA
ncbi:MAG: glycosyltransferase [Eubacteriales bacterium]|nr:glycosyltransferase [Eubacteriales bacterium]